MADEWGRCLNGTDRCQRFYPSDGKERVCECCGCHRNLHAPPGSSVSDVSDVLRTPVKSSVQASTGSLRSSPRLEAKRASEAGSSEKESPLKRQKDSHEVGEGNNSKLSGGVKVEPSEQEQKVNELKSKTRKPPTKLLTAWNLLVKAYPPDAVGQYELTQDEGGVWVVKCDLCKAKKPEGYGTDPNFTLSNFKNQHFKSKLHKDNLAKWKEGKDKAEEKLAQERADLKAKREALVAEYAARGWWLLTFFQE
jgi:hypothetical protein